MFLAQTVDTKIKGSFVNKRSFLIDFHLYHSWYKKCTCMWF